MYCTVADLITRFGETEIIQLSDRQRTGEINNTVVDMAIADARAEIDGYLSGRYTLPLEQIPEHLKMYACDVARYRLFEDGAYEHVTERYNNAMRFLRDVASGRMQLFAVGVDDAPVQEAIIKSRPSIFGGGF